MVAIQVLITIAFISIVLIGMSLAISIKGSDKVLELGQASLWTKSGLVLMCLFTGPVLYYLIVNMLGEWHGSKRAQWLFGLYTLIAIVLKWIGLYFPIWLWVCS